MCPKSWLCQVVIKIFSPRVRSQLERYLKGLEVIMATPSYDQDFYAWAMRNAELLRQGRFSEIDAMHIAEELEDMGRSSKRALASRLEVLVAHLPKWTVQKEIRQLHANSWRATIKEQRRMIAKLLKENPSLKQDLSGNFQR